MAKISLELVESNQQIQSKIIRAIRTEIDKRLARVNVGLIPQIKGLIEQGIKEQPEYDSLDNGKLAAAFGLSDGRARIDSIIDYWLNNIRVRVKRSQRRGSQIVAGLEIDAIPMDYDTVAELPEAVVLTNKGQALPWLRWLLVQGAEGFIIDYDIIYGPIPRSRSGKAVMRVKPGSRWGVPTEFSGTPTNNFVTRAIDKVKADLDKVVQKAVSREFS